MSASFLVRVISLLVLGVSLLFMRYAQVGKEHVAASLRAPQPGSLIGWLLQQGMKNFNAEASILLVDVLNPQIGSVLVEVGVGPGTSFAHTLSLYQPKRLYGLEISPAFYRSAVQRFHKEIQSGTVSLHLADARRMTFLADASVDGLYALNVIYFLHPLEDYLQEIHRILRPGAKLVFGVDEKAKRWNSTGVFVNTDWDDCLEQMRRVGFVSVQQVDLMSDRGSGHHDEQFSELRALIGWKSQDDFDSAQQE